MPKSMDPNLPVLLVLFIYNVIALVIITRKVNSPILRLEIRRNEKKWGFPGRVDSHVLATH